MIKTSKSILLSALVILALISCATMQKAYAVSKFAPIEQTPEGTVIETTQDIIFVPNTYHKTLKRSKLIPSHKCREDNDYNYDKYDCGYAREGRLTIRANNSSGSTRILRAGTKLSIKKIEINDEMRVIITHKSIKEIYRSSLFCNCNWVEEKKHKFCSNYSFEKMNYRIKDFEGKLFGYYFKIVSIPEMEEM